MWVPESKRGALISQVLFSSLLADRLDDLLDRNTLLFQRVRVQKVLRNRALGVEEGSI